MSRGAPALPDDAPLTVEAYRTRLDALLAPNTPVALAVSGGSDSRALLELTAALAADGRASIAAVLTVDHRLRPESAAEAAKIAGRCECLGVPHHTLTWDGPKPTANIAAAAREARYRLMREWRRSAGVKPLLLGHTRDDVAETFLLRLARGSGVDGLSEMAARFEEGDGLELLRPVLDVSRSALRGTCRAVGADWFDDPTNDDPRFDRAAARQALAVLAPLGVTPERLAKTARSMRRARTALERRARSLAEAAASWRRDIGWVALSTVALAEADREIALRVLAGLLREVSGAPYPPRLDSLEAALDALTEGEPGRTLHGCLIGTHGAEHVYIAREPAACAPAAPVPVGAPIVWDGRFEVHARRPGLTVRSLMADGAAQARRAASDTAAFERVWRDTPRAAVHAQCGLFDGDVLYAAPAPGWRRSDVDIRPVRAEMS